MKKLLVLLLIICVITISVFCVLNYFDDSEGVYPDGGRDTHIQFGDGRFVILSGDYLVLYDRSEEKVYKNGDYTIEPHIYSYLEVYPYVYIKGSYGYTKLNYNSGEVVQSETITDFTNEDALVFEKLSNQSQP